MATATKKSVKGNGNKNSGTKEAIVAWEAIL